MFQLVTSWLTTFVNIVQKNRQDCLIYSEIFIRIAKIDKLYGLSKRSMWHNFFSEK
jgi:hypothetical protein